MTSNNLINRVRKIVLRTWLFISGAMMAREKLFRIYLTMEIMEPPRKLGPLSTKISQWNFKILGVKIARHNFP